MIAGYAQHGHCEEALEVFRQIQQVGLKPNQIDYMSILNAYASPTALERDKEVHAHIIDAGFQSDVYLATPSLTCTRNVGASGTHG